MDQSNYAKAGGKVGHMQGQSEIARLRARMQAEYEACHNALHGPALGMARHEFITARMERIMDHAEALKQLAGQEVAMQALRQMEDGLS